MFNWFKNPEKKKYNVECWLLEIELENGIIVRKWTEGSVFSWSKNDVEITNPLTRFQYLSISSYDSRITITEENTTYFGKLKRITVLEKKDHWVEI